MILVAETIIGIIDMDMYCTFFIIDLYCWLQSIQCTVYLLELTVRELITTLYGSVIGSFSLEPFN